MHKIRLIWQTMEPYLTKDEEKELSEIANRIEKRTGESIEINVKRHRNGTETVNSFEKNRIYEVYNTNPAYNSIEGEYKSIDAINKEIWRARLANAQLFMVELTNSTEEYGYYKWICGECGKYGGHAKLSKCKKCGKVSPRDTSNILIDLHTGQINVEIRNTFGNRVSIGYIRIKNESSDI